jgi:hypothetical protein
VSDSVTVRLIQSESRLRHQVQGHVQVFQHVKNRARALFAQLHRRDDDTNSRLDTKAMELRSGDVKARRDSDQPTNERAPDAACAANSLMGHETGPLQASLDDPGSSDVHQGSYSAAGSAMISSGDQLRELYMNMRHMCVACDPLASLPAFTHCELD